MTKRLLTVSCWQFAIMNYAQIFPIALSLFLIMDPLGNTPVFLAILKDHSPKRQRRIVLRETVFALVFILGFYFIGETVLTYLNIEQSSIRISGGIILFIMAIKMIFPQLEKNNSDLYTEDPFIVPIAIPLIAGPSLIATISLYAHQVHNDLIVLMAILVAWVGNLVVYSAMTLLKNVLKERGLKACERLMGLILMMISVQMFLDGLTLYRKA